MRSFAFGLIVVAACTRSPENVLQATDKGGAEPDTRALRLGSGDRVLVWWEDEKRDGFANMDRVYSVRTFPRAGRNPRSVCPLPVGLRDLSHVKVQGLYSIDDFRERHRVAGLLVIKRGQIVYERYAFGHSPLTKWTSWSVAKSVVSMLVGAAIRDGYIRSVGDRASDYLPSLKGTSYDRVTIENLLQMASGAKWSERYEDPNSDITRFGRLRSQGEPALLRHLGEIPLANAPGSRFNYSTSDAHLVGSVVRAAVGNNLSDYLSRTIWSQFAMESDGYWVIDAKSGAEHGGCCFSATLRDFGRLGLFALRKGRLLDETSVLPDGYMDAAMAPSSASAEYGYLWWLNRRSFGARGIFGQQIQIYPEDDLVIVSHAFAEHPSASFDYSLRLFEGIREALAP